MVSLVQVLPGHSRWVHDCCWSADGGHAFSAGFDNAALVHTVTDLCGGSGGGGGGGGGSGSSSSDPVDSGAIQLLHGSRVRAVCCLPNLIAATGSKSGVQLWDVGAAGSLQRCFATPGIEEVQATVAWTAGAVAAGGTGKSSEVLLFDARDGKAVASLAGHTSGITRLCAEGIEDGLLCSAAMDGTAKLWEPRTRTCICTLRHGHRGGVRTCAFSQPGAGFAPSWLVLTGGYDRAVVAHALLRDLSESSTPAVCSHTKKLVCEHKGYCFSLACSGTTTAGGLVATGAGNPDYALRLWRWKQCLDDDNVDSTNAQMQQHREGGVMQLAEVQVLAGNREHASCCAFSPCGRRLLSGGEGGVLRIWNLFDETPGRTPERAAEKGEAKLKKQRRD